MEDVAQAVQQARAAAEAIGDERSRAQALSAVAQALAATEQNQQALDAYLKAFKSAWLAGRGTTLSVLEQAAPTLAGIDGGQTLLQVYENVVAVEAWWGA
jgi:hypothetical protein